PPAPRTPLSSLPGAPSHPLAPRVHTERAQQLQRVLGGDPGVRYERGAAPMAIRSLKVQQAGPPTLRGHTRSLTRNGRVRLGDQVAHDLPPNRRIRVEQPLDDAHPHTRVSGCVTWLQGERGQFGLVGTWLMASAVLTTDSAA